MSARSVRILVLPGDGIGPEVMQQGVHVLEAVAPEAGLDLEMEHGHIGGAALDAEGAPLSDATLETARRADVILLGAVGGPKWDGYESALRPERGLLRLRKELGLFANLRPAVCFEALVDASPLKPELVAGLDIMIVRELTGGVYFGTPRGVERRPDGTRRGVNTHHYDEAEIARIARSAFELAEKRDRRVTSVDKANVMEAGALWREVVGEVARDYPDVALNHMYADNCAMQLVRAPKQFDVILTDNLFGDILSDEASMLTGSLGMLPSASLGARDPENGRQAALYEPVHGSAPDIAGANVANPLAAILCTAMALRYTLGAEDAAARIEEAVARVLADGPRTADIGGAGGTTVSTRDMGEAVLARLA